MQALRTALAPLQASTVQSGLAMDGDGNLYVADSDNHRIRKVAPAGEVTTLAGSCAMHGFADGAGTAASFNRSSWLWRSHGDGNLYVADSHNHRIRVLAAGLRPPEFSPASTPSTFAEDLATLLTDDSLTDVTFAVNGEHIRAHRNLLVSRSRHA